MPKPSSDRRILTSCDRGADELQPVLHLAYPAEAQSTLELKFPGGISCEVNLAPRHTLFLLLAADAWNQDEGEVESQRGYRTKLELSRRLGNPSNENPLSETAVAQYVKEIRKQITSVIMKAVASLDLPDGYQPEIPNLIEGERFRGYRIGPCGLVILEARESLLLTT